MNISQRTPVHVVYGGAHLFKYDTPQKLGKIAFSSFRTYASTPTELAKALGLAGSDDLINKTFERTQLKLETEPVEDFRIDFEDGYGVRPDDEEDQHAISAAESLGRAFAERINTSFTGIRIKPFSLATRPRAVRTLSVFVSRLLESTSGKLPGQFAVTLPKVASESEVSDLADVLTDIETRHDLANGSITIELMFETPLAIFDREGKVATIKLIEAAHGRCRSAHFGAYDYTAALGISAKHQGLRHPACELARNIMLATLVPLGVRVVDSVTTEIPAPPHRGTALSETQKTENRDTVHHAWRAHFENVLYSMSNGFYQSWDLHPNQLVARFAAVNYFYLDGFEEQAARLKNYVDSAAQATLTGTAFDDAASARGVVNFFLRGSNCGALSNNEIKAATGLDRSRLYKLFPE
jgi:citrate lyase beta subunit